MYISLNLSTALIFDICNIQFLRSANKSINYTKPRIILKLSLKDNVMAAGLNVNVSVE